VSGSSLNIRAQEARAKCFSLVRRKIDSQAGELVLDAILASMAYIFTDSKKEFVSKILPLEYSLKNGDVVR
jgi:hypothetical protein